MQELNLLELDFLRMNGFVLNIRVEELQKYGDQLWRHHLRQVQTPFHRLPTPPPDEKETTNTNA